MKVLCDLHHKDLFYSLQLLFEKRLGYTIYRPIGLAWYLEGYWKVYDHPSTAKQYLSIEGQVPLSVHGVPVTKEYGEIAWVNKNAQELLPGLYRIPDRQHEKPIPHIGITLQAFKDTKFDLIVCSMPPHLPVFRKLRDQFQPQAKLIFQAGNDWGTIDAENLLTSPKHTTSSRRNANVVRYHQEFDLEAYKPGPCENPRSIINLQHYSSSVSKLEQVAKYLPNWDLKIYGAGGRDGHVVSIKLPRKLNDTGFLWHVKAQEGYGYNIHTAFACGTPVIVGYSYQKGHTAGDLYVLDQTVIDANTNTPQQIAEKLIIAADNYEEWSYRVYKQFRKVVNFDKEFEDIKVFLQNLR